MNNKIEMKMKKNQLTMLVLFVTMLGFTACSDDDKVSISTVGITTTVDKMCIRDRRGVDQRSGCGLYLRKRYG